jgi:peptidoglycan/LPS O-acetylase OafA/YrhL
MIENTVARPPSLPALTGVRFIAAIGVLLYHYGASFLERSGIPHPIAQLLHNGYLGVSLFFVLSGFILTYTHQTDIINERFIGDFYVARFARIYPVYFLVLMIGFPVISAPLSPTSMAAVILMLQSWTPPQSGAGYLWVMQAWTLSVEFFFYLCFPAILLCAKRLNAIATSLVAAGAAILIVMFGLSSVVPGTTEIPYMSSTGLPIPVLRTAEFIYGVMLCRLTYFYPRVSKAIGGNIFEFVLTALIVIVMSFGTDVHIKALFTVLIGVLIIQLSGGRGAISAALSSKPFMVLGGASYALYLLQGPVRAFCEHLVPHPFDRFVSPAITVGGAIAVFRLWEQPCRKTILSAYRFIRNRGLPERVPVRDSVS